MFFKKNEENPYNIGDKLKVQFEIVKISKEYGELRYYLKADHDKSEYGFFMVKKDMMDALYSKNI